MSDKKLIRKTKEEKFIYEYFDSSILLRKKYRLSLSQLFTQLEIPKIIPTHFCFHFFQFFVAYARHIEF